MSLAGRNLPGKARDRGMNVLEMGGWEGKGEGGTFVPRGILLHHDAMGLGYIDSNLSNNLNVPKYMSQNGNDGSQVWIGRDTANRMTLVFLAAGIKWHAGRGQGFRSIPSGQGNTYCIGIETDHTTGTGWDADIMRYIDLTTWLFCDEFSIDPDRWLAGHREYAPDRKVDPESYDLNAWRQRAKTRTTVITPPVTTDKGFIPRFMHWNT
jgi:N-acetylmuramoyl-L-alanine amidase